MPGRKQQTGAVLEDNSETLQVRPVGANDKFHRKEKDNEEERVGGRMRTGHIDQELVS